MVQVTLPTKKEWIRHAKTYCDSLSIATAHCCGPSNGSVTPGSTTALDASHRGRNCRTFSTICGPPRSPRPSSGGPAWLPSRARGADRDWGGARQGPPGAGSQWQRDSLSLGAPVPLYPAVDKPGGAAALAVPQRRLDRGLLRGVTDTLGARGT